MKKHLQILLLILVSINCNGQDEGFIDSLYIELDNAQEDSVKATVYLEILQDVSDTDWVLLNKLFQEAKPLLEKFPDKYYDALSIIGWTGVIVGEFEKSDSIHAVLIKAYENQPFKRKRLFLSLAVQNYMLFKLLKADSLINLSFSENDLALEGNTDLYKQIQKAYNFRGVLNNVQGKFLDADKNLKISLKYAGKVDNPQRKVGVYANLFYTNFDKGKVNESLIFLQKSFDVYLKNPEGKIRTLETYITLLDFYTDVGLEIVEEQRLFDKAQAYIKEMGTDYLYFDLKLILLKKYLKQKDISKSKDIIKQLKEFMDTSDVRLYLSRFYEAQIKYYLLIDNKEKAQELIDKLYTLSLEQGLKNYEALSYVYQTELNNENTEEAIKNLEKAYELGAKYDNIRIKKLSIGKLIDYYKEIEDFQKITKYLQEIITLNKSLVFNQEGLNNFSHILNQVQKHLDSDAPEITITPLKGQDKLDKKFIYILIIASFFTICLLFYFLKKTNRQKQLRDQIIKKENKEKREKERATKFNKLKTQLSSSEIDWTLFLAEYRMLFPVFMKKLESLDINLTSNTLKNLICIRMGLNAKETAIMNSVSVDAVNKAKYRIKKQLKLGANQSLVDFIQKL